MWKKIDSSEDSIHYGIIGVSGERCGLQDLREMFSNPRKQINSDNFVIFSTGGVHGFYTTIEEVEEAVKVNPNCGEGVTFLVVHPRIVSLRYGNCYPKTEEDFAFLYLLRSLSISVLCDL